MKKEAKEPKEAQEFRKLLAINIRRFREQAGLSQLDLSSDLNMSTAFLSDIELGKKWPHPGTLARIAKGLNIEIYQLFLPEQPSIEPEKSAEILKYLDSIDNALVKHIANSLKSDFIQTATRATTKMRKHYEKAER
ncbi:MAG: helix-turn-helix domain-containing protein [Spirochaetaceae bacterium]|jgi:transcriptional regulator with XRE-family HTH domain|nr:helix-turn-helix domain-containing protein [Spirochaetaceae bacterium]